MRRFVRIIQAVRKQVVNGAIYMMNSTIDNMNEMPEYAYHLLRGALEKFKKNIQELSPGQYEQTKIIADKTYALESIVLSTPEARDVLIPETELDAAIEKVEERYTDRDAYLLDLSNNGLNEEILRSALYRELLFDVVMDKVSSKSPQISDIDVQLFYQLHKDRFTRPEKRKVRHILITVNPEYAENDRSAAYSRVTVLAEKLQKNPGRFEALAKKHSECPTAIEGGKLGEVVRGTLYPELDAELFAMSEGEISSVIETEMGFHILYCEKITKSIVVPMSRAKPRIKQILHDRQIKACQKSWLEKIKKDNIQEDSLKAEKKQVDANG